MDSTKRNWGTIALAVGAVAGGIVACVLSWKLTGAKRILGVIAGLAALALGGAAIAVQVNPTPPPEMKAKDL